MPPAHPHPSRALVRRCCAVVPFALLVPQQPCGATYASVESLLPVPGEVVWADTGGTQETWQGRCLGSTWPRPRRVDCIGV